MILFSIVLLRSVMGLTILNKAKTGRAYPQTMARTALACKNSNFHMQQRIKGAMSLRVLSLQAVAATFFGRCSVEQDPHKFHTAVYDGS